MMERAYAPYSDFPVGVAGLVDDGRVVAGCNVEKRRLRGGHCAPSAAWSRTFMPRVAAAWSPCTGVGGDGEALMACGRCRQLLWENGGPDCRVMTPTGVLTMAELLPQAFGRDDLGRHQPER